MRSHAEFRAAAEARVGGAAALEAVLPTARSPRALARITDDRWLAAMTRAVFRAGFVWRIVEAKWPGFEAAFSGFDTMACAMLGDEDLERLHADERIIRHPTKIRAVRDNAAFVRLKKQDAGSFAGWIADWPTDDVVGLWAALKAEGARLGGNTGPFMLREMGKDTFLLTNDVVRALVGAGVVDKRPTGKGDLARTQAAFNAWAEESGDSLCRISRTLALAVG